jgi:hypothetical protein
MHHSSPDEKTWEKLTASPRKPALFADDLYFREAWADVQDSWDGKGAEILQDLALFTFKSDGVIGRRIRPTLSFFERQGFALAAVAPMRHNRHSMRELWRYDWNLYPTDRLALTSLMHGATETLLLLLRDTRYDGVIPGTVRLADLKGSVSQEWGPQHLRSVLKPPNRVINFCHIADEPADVVRELGIFLDRRERRDLLNTMREDGGDLGPAVLAQVDRLESAYPEHDFDLRATLERIEQSGRAPAWAVDRIRNAAESGEQLTFDQLCEVLPPGEGDAELWDFILVATAVLPLEREGQQGLLPAPIGQDWRRRHEENQKGTV